MSFTKHKGTDNYITCKEDWFRIKDYIPNDKVIWCPFFCDGSQKKYFKEMGFDVIHQDEDFFQKNRGGCCIDNPPFSKIKDVFMRLKDLNKPFIIIARPVLLGCKWFQDAFKDGLQLIIPSKRVYFYHLENQKKKYTPPFGTFYYCWKMGLEKDLIFID